MSDRIHPTALIDPGAELAGDVTVGPFSVIHGNVVLEDGVRIGSHCAIGEPARAGDHAPLRIGRAGHVRSHSVLYEGSEFGPDLVTGNRVTIREGLRAGKNLQVGTLSDLQGEATIGDYVRLHSNVHIGQLSQIGNFVWIFPYCVLTNDPHPPSEGSAAGVLVEEFAVIATATTVLPGIRIGTRCLVAAHSLVNRHVDPDKVVGGVPAKVLADAPALQLKDGRGPAYPWMRHFHRGYPAEVVEEWGRAYGAAERT